MNLVTSQARINKLMSYFVKQIEGEAPMGRTDLYKASETILISLLNEVYGWELKNLNSSEENSNYPGIDLADKTAGICVQVTATTSLKKITHTLEQYIKNEQYLKYGRLIIFMLKDRQHSYSESTIQKAIQSRFKFDPKKDIWDYRNILKEISSFQIDKTLKVQEILEANFGDGRRLEKPIDWQETCRELLNQWKGLTTNALTTSNGVCFHLDEMFVPLGVVERQQKTKHCSSGGSPEQGSELYEEKVTPISQNDFFEQVLRQRQSKNSQGSRIAIIGEPGAGKTTQLQKIGDWILQETDDIPIWIPLAAVGTKTLKEYLLNDWLQTATPNLEIPQQHQDELEQLLRTRKVWLLLDGVDEMASVDALHQITTQMHEGWWQNVRVVLTCRLNVWDTGKNALDDRFDVYRNLDFDYATQVHQFIKHWFVTEPKLQQNLTAALEQPGKERIRDMVKNPLRLTLLCYSWKLRQGELPETKAGLYEWFMDAFYDWNKGKVPRLKAAKRKELNNVLGELAKEAIDQESSRFRLREKFINQFLDDADDEDSLFYLALQLGWLNRVGVAAENPLEAVYAFLHPTFQEYFAALAIDDCDDFLPHGHVNSPIENRKGKCKYRIFEPQWREVFLLWCGRTDVCEDARLLIKKLIDFESGCSSFHFFRAYFLAATAVSELGDYEVCEEVVDNLINWGFFTKFVPSTDKWWHDCPIEQQAKETLQFTDQSVAVNRLIQIIDTTEKSHKQRDLAELLGKISLRNTKAVEVLTRLLGSNKSGWTAIGVAKGLWLIDPGNLDAIKAFIKFLNPEEGDVVSHEAAEAVGSNNIQTSEIISALIDLAKRDGNNFTHGSRKILRALGKIGVCERRVIDAVIDLINRAQMAQKYESQHMLIWTLGEVGLGDSQASNYLISLLSETNEESSRWSIAGSLGRIGINSSEVIATLSSLTSKHEAEWTRQQAAESLLKITPNNLDALNLLIDLLHTTENWRTQRRVIISLEKIATGNLLVIGTLSKFLEECSSEYIREQAAKTLGKIDPGNEQAVNALIQLLNSKHNAPGVNSGIIWDLGDIGEGNLKAIKALTQFLERTYEDSSVKHFHEQNFSVVSRSLRKIVNDTTYQLVIQNLKKYISEEMYRNDFDRFHPAYEVIWHCAQNMNYPDFYQTWHSFSSTTDAELSTG